MIEGVFTRRLRVMADERGRLQEILRCDDEGFTEFGQVYVTSVYPGVVKGWHLHRKQTDNIACISGMVKLVIYDGRSGSPTKGELMELFIGEHNPMLVHVPPELFHGFKCVGESEALVLNVPDLPYDRENPDEERLDPNSDEIPYDWARKDR